MWSISILSGSWTMWPWWQAWDLSKGCPEGQSGSSSCYNILHAKSLLSPLSWTVNDHGHYKPLVLRNPGKEQPKKKKKNSQLQTCATAYEKGSTGGTKSPESRARRMKTHLQVLESMKKLHLPRWVWLVTDQVKPASNRLFCTGMLICAFPTISIRNWELVFISFTVLPIEKNSTWDYAQGNSFIFSTLGECCNGI